jgi:hypothetical protein
MEVLSVKAESSVVSLRRQSDRRKCRQIMGNVKVGGDVLDELSELWNGVMKSPFGEARLWSKQTCQLFASAPPKSLP